MLFALTFDKVMFGHTPDLMSILGSTLILASAIYVATQIGPTKSKDTSETGQASADEEAQRGLMSGMDIGTGEDHDSFPVQEVQLRTLR